MSSVTTKRGDAGQTDMLFGVRVTKNHPRMIALGSVDELNAALGHFRLLASTKESIELIPNLQKWLITLMGELATPVGKEDHYLSTHKQSIQSLHIETLENIGNHCETNGALQFKGWALPGEGGSQAAAWADTARTICRRAERDILHLADTESPLTNPLILQFLNRLSDTLWLLARWEEKYLQSKDQS